MSLYFWRYWESLQPAPATMYGTGDNPKRLERLVISSDDTGYYFTRTIPPNKIGADLDEITRIKFALSADEANREIYPAAMGGVSIKLDAHLVSQLVGMKAGFALSTNKAKALSIVDDSGQIILMAGNPVGGKYSVWFTGYYEHVAPKNPNGQYPLTKRIVKNAAGEVAYFPADAWVNVQVYGRMNSIKNGVPVPDAECRVVCAIDGTEIGRAVLDNFVIADLPGNGWQVAEWVCFSGGEGDQYRFSSAADIHFKDFWFEPIPATISNPLPDPGQDEKDILIAELLSKIDRQVSEIDRQMSEIDSLVSGMAAKDILLEEIRAANTTLQNEIDTYRSEIAALKSVIYDRDRLIVALKKSDEDLTTIRKIINGTN